MKLKKTLVVLLLLSMVTFIFTACGSSNGGSASAEVTAENVFGDFKAIDINENPVDKSVFSGKTLTMVNLWGTYCDPCIREMSDLGEINREYADKGFQIIGIPIDAPGEYGTSADYVITNAKDIIKTTKADYLHILPSKDLIDAKISEVTAVPETIFVDENGNQVGESYIGSRSKEDWIAIIDSLLAKMNKQ